ncbi:MAG: HAMP domain-containing protein [Deltaproteobacteria bacterium]|nr:HAMP domain-containing protein [Deltaproteobacteria bacterium]
MVRPSDRKIPQELPGSGAGLLQPDRGRNAFLGQQLEPGHNLRGIHAREPERPAREISDGKAQRVPSEGGKGRPEGPSGGFELFQGARCRCPEEELRHGYGQPIRGVLGPRGSGLRDRAGVFEDRNKGGGGSRGRQQIHPGRLCKPPAGHLQGASGIQAAQDAQEAHEDQSPDHAVHRNPSHHFLLGLVRVLCVPGHYRSHTNRIASGDYDFFIDMESKDEIGILVNSFNRMTMDLKTSKNQLEAANLELRRSNIELEQRRLYMEIVLANVAAGVISADSRGKILTMNKSAEDMLDRRNHRQEL